MTMRRRYIPAAAVLVLLGACMPGARAFATASTHIWAPSTDIQAFKVWHVTSDLYLPVERDAAGGTLPAVTNLGLTVGILPFDRLNVEVGFDHKSGFGPLDGYPMYGNAKIGIPENAFGGISPALAAGVFDVGTKRNRTDYDIFYVEIAKSVSLGDVSFGRLSLGYFNGNEKLLVDGSGGKDNSGVLAAWERTVSELSDKLWVCLEYMGTESAYGTLNVGASWKVAGNVSLLGGYDIFSNRNIVDTVTLQVDIDI
jgi:hypothetical protein